MSQGTKKKKCSLKGEALPKNSEKSKESTESTHAPGLRTLSQVTAWGGQDPEKQGNNSSETNLVDSRKKAGHGL